MSGFAKLLSPKSKLWIVALLVGALHIPMRTTNYRAVSIVAYSTYTELCDARHDFAKSMHEDSKNIYSIFFSIIRESKLDVSLISPNLKPTLF